MINTIMDKDTGTEIDTNKRITRPDDPRRCQRVTAHGQCQMVRIPDSQYCAMHTLTKKNDLSNYRLTKWKARVQELANSDGIKSLRDEIGILRMMLEEKMNMIKDATELLCVSHVISDLVLKIEKLVTSCHRIEKSMGDLIDRSVVINMAEQIVSIIEDELKDVENGQDLMRQIADRMEPVLSNTGRGEDDEDDS